MDCIFDTNPLVCSVCGVSTKWPGVPRNCAGVFVGEDAGEAISTPPPAPEPMPQRGPGFLEKVRNFATSAAAHVAAGMPMASDEEIIRRHDICLGCEHLQAGACTQCGCPISRVAGYVSKLSWANEECPVGKWEKATAKKPALTAVRYARTL